MWFQNHLNDRYQAVKIKNIILKYYPLHRILFSVKNDDNQDILFLFFVFCETGIEFLYQSEPFVAFQYEFHRWDTRNNLLSEKLLIFLDHHWQLGQKKI